MTKDQALLFTTKGTKWSFEEALLGCWGDDARMVSGWLETIDSSIWFDDLAVARKFHPLVLQTPEDGFVIYESTW